MDRKTKHGGRGWRAVIVLAIASGALGLLVAESADGRPALPRAEACGLAEAALRDRGASSGETVLGLLGFWSALCIPEPAPR